MKTTKFARFILIAFVALTLIVPQAKAQQGFGRHQMMMKKAERRSDVAALNLTDEQQQQISDLRLQNQKEALPLQTDLRNKQAELKLMMVEQQPNLKRIDKKIDEISKIKAELKKKQTKHHFEVRRILTPAQRKIFDSHILMDRKINFHGKGKHRRYQMQQF